MTWKDEIKKVNVGGGEERFPDSDRDWMEDDAANAFNPERHIIGVIKDIVGSATFGGGLLDDIEERLGKEEEQEHISFPKGFDKAKVRKQLVPIIEEIVRSTIKVDLDKYTYSGP